MILSSSVGECDGTDDRTSSFAFSAFSLVLATRIKVHSGSTDLNSFAAYKPIPLKQKKDKSVKDQHDKFTLRRIIVVKRLLLTNLLHPVNSIVGGHSCTVLQAFSMFVASPNFSMILLNNDNKP